MPDFDARLVIGSRNAEAAGRMAVAWKQLIDVVASEIKHRMESGPLRAQELMPLVDEIITLLQPSVEEDRLVIAITKEAIHPVVQQFLIPAVKPALQSVLRSQRLNQFKHLALAMHVLADVNNGALPPAAIAGEDGKPLLSWRVAILRYLKEGKLYDQFHLDEPWDSEHNKKLIEKMPDIYKDRDLASVLSDNRLALGRTTYVVPVGEGLVFGRKEGTQFREIADGTSRTIMFVEVVPERAVIWTKPDDWQVNMDNPLLGVKRTDRNGFTAAWCDGSIRFIPNDVDAKKLRAMLTRAGGEVDLWSELE